MPNSLVVVFDVVKLPSGATFASWILRRRAAWLAIVSRRGAGPAPLGGPEIKARDRPQTHRRLYISGVLGSFQPACTHEWVKM